MAPPERTGRRVAETGNPVKRRCPAGGAPVVSRRCFAAATFSVFAATAIPAYGAGRTPQVSPQTLPSASAHLPSRASGRTPRGAPRSGSPRCLRARRGVRGGRRATSGRPSALGKGVGLFPESCPGLAARTRSRRACELAHGRFKTTRGALRQVRARAL